MNSRRLTDALAGLLAATRGKASSLRLGKMFLAAVSLVSIISSAILLPTPTEARPLPPDGIIHGTAMVTDFGGDVYRNHRSDEELGLPLCPAWAVNLGQSRSQPLSVRDRIYHLAGDSLWALRKVATVPPGLSNDEVRNRVVEWRVPGIQTAPSSSHPAYVEQTVTMPNGHTYHGVIYAGTGPVPGGAPDEHSLIAVAAEDGTVLRKVALPSEIVSAPLVLGDTIVFGTVDGWVWAAKGMVDFSLSKPEINRIQIGGRVSSSPVPIAPNEFVIGSDGVDGDLHGFVRAYNTDLEPVWSEPIRTPFGVPASFAVADGYLYFTDKHGILYSVDAPTGYITWTTMVDASGLGGSQIFINNSPAVDDRNVYVTVRELQPSGQGQLVAFPRNIAGTAPTALWRANLPGRGNTAPLIWRPAGLVLVGDTTGHITAWRAPQTGEPAGEGQPVPFATEATCGELGGLSTITRTGSPGQLLSTITLVDNPYRDSIGWSQSSGAGTEMSLADGMLLAGANSSNDRDIFLVFRKGDPVDLTLTGELLEAGPYETGQVLHARFRIANQADKPHRQMLVYGWRDGEPQFKFIQLPPNGSISVEVEMPPVPDGAESLGLMAMVNPLYVDTARRAEPSMGLPALPAKWEAVLYGRTPASPDVQDGFNWLDATSDSILYELAPYNNTWTQDLTIAPPGNLVMTNLAAPDTIPAPEPPANPEYVVTAVVNNDSSRTIDTTIRLIIDSQAVRGGQIERNVTLPPGVSRHSFTVPGSAAGDVIRVTATVDPDRSIAETSYTDNSASATTKVEDVTPVDPGDGYGKVDDVLQR